MQFIIKIIEKIKINVNDSLVMIKIMITHARIKIIIRKNTIKNI